MAPEAPIVVAVEFGESRTVRSAAPIPQMTNLPYLDLNLDDMCLSFARPNEPSRVEQSCAQRRCFHQRTHLAEIKKQGFSGHYKAEQLKTHCGVVAYHS